MLRKIGHLTVILALTAVLAHAQRAANTPNEFDMYCSGLISTQAPPQDTYVISGVESDQRIVFGKGNLVFIDKGAKQGVRVGDQFEVSRSEYDHQMAMPWVTWWRASVRCSLTMAPSSTVGPTRPQTCVRRDCRSASSRC